MYFVDFIYILSVIVTGCSYILGYNAIINKFIIRIEGKASKENCVKMARVGMVIITFFPIANTVKAIKVINMYLFKK